MHRLLLTLSLFVALNPLSQARPADGPVRVLFLGHEAEVHNSNKFFPMLAEALGRDAIYFDYVTTVAEALDDAAFLDRFDALLLYANHAHIEPAQWQNLLSFVERGGAFIPVHSASWCFHNEPAFFQLVGGRFRSHQDAIFRPRIVAPDHPAMQDVAEFEAWDETYVHSDHNDENRTVLMVRDQIHPGDPISTPEPWTWVRTQGDGRVFYTASGHDERTWSLPEFHGLLKAGILWAIGDDRRASHQAFLEARPPLTYEARPDVPNYEQRPEPLPYQFPLAPEHSLLYTRAPAGAQLTLFAAEPDIINPMCLAWDSLGRLWTIETTDYPNEVRKEGGNDKIKILHDTTGDGRADSVTVFADGLNIPTSLVPLSPSSAIVSMAPNMLLLEDTTGDGTADTRTVLFSGFGTGDTHAGPSNLRLGIDNWIYGTVGYSGFDGTVGGESLRFGMGVFRFRPDGSKLEWLHQFNNNTWGLGFNAAADTFGSTANNNPSFHGHIPATVAARPVPQGQQRADASSARMIAANSEVHPITPNIRQVDAFGRYTAAAGHAFANSDAFPTGWHGRRAFVCEPTGHLLGMFQVVPDGASFRSIKAFSLVASADEWFSPVAAEVGPDGHLWIADWYNFIIQHNPTPTPERGGYKAETGPGNAHVNPLRDESHGRIYRLVLAGHDKPASPPNSPTATQALLDSLAHPNQLHRLQAQWQIIGSAPHPPELAAGLASALSTAVTTHAQLPPSDENPADAPRSPHTLQAIHALWTLEGLGALDIETLRAALLSPHPALRRNAIRALPHDESGLALLSETGAIADPDPLTRLACFTTLSFLPTSPPLQTAIAGLLTSQENRGDPALSAALQNAAAIHQVALPGTAPLIPGPTLLSTTFADPDPADPARPLGWSVRTYNGNAEHAWAKGEGRDGTPALRITSAQGADTSWHAAVDLKASKLYRLSAWVKTEGVAGAMGALLNVHELQRQATTDPVSANSGWTEISTDFSPENDGRYTVNALFGGWGQSRGTAWFDSVSLTELVPDPDASSTPPQLAPGDPGRGHTLFLEHPIAACNRCHILDGEGGPVGPALDGIASRFDEEYLRRSLLDPQADIAEGYPIPISSMPPMGLLLNAQEIEDVLAFLLSLTE